MKQRSQISYVIELIFFGCIAIVFYSANRPKHCGTKWAALTDPRSGARWDGALYLFFFAAAVIFWMALYYVYFKASPERKQLDSLSDVVAFGQLREWYFISWLRLGYTREED